MNEHSNQIHCECILIAKYKAVTNWTWFISATFFNSLNFVAIKCVRFVFSSFLWLNSINRFCCCFLYAEIDLNRWIYKEMCHSFFTLVRSEKTCCYEGNTLVRRIPKIHKSQNYRKGSVKVQANPSEILCASKKSIAK